MNNSWQPIETAPKDGTKVLLHRKGGGPFAPCEWVEKGQISEEGFWLWWQAAPEYFTEVVNPTYWMPLPNLPEGA